mgnify:CR=1 FL=1
MSYDGETLTSCGALNLDFSTVAVVAVSGDGINGCGHCILAVGSSAGSTYFHVAGRNSNPKYMSQAGYSRYLVESKKTEWKRIRIQLPNPTAAFAKLEELLSKPWLWLVLPNNCVAFVEEVIAAGGATWSSGSNCPAIAVTDSSDIGRLFNMMEASIYYAYGVPR